MDLICTNCGEPWSVFHVGDMKAGLKGERDIHPMDLEGWEFSKMGAIIHCGCCESNKAYNGEDSQDEKDRLAAIREISELLGDDLDGASSLLEDFNLI